MAFMAHHSYSNITVFLQCIERFLCKSVCKICAINSTQHVFSSLVRLQPVWGIPFFISLTRIPHSVTQWSITISHLELLEWSFEWLFLILRLFFDSKTMLTVQLLFLLLYTKQQQQQYGVLYFQYCMVCTCVCICISYGLSTAPHRVLSM